MLSFEIRPGGPQLAVDLGGLADGAGAGESVAVNGVCLTVSRVAGRAAEFRLSPETLARSNLARLSRGDAVNVERALRHGDRLGGHFVQGHVDGLAAVKAIKKNAGFAEVELAADNELVSLLVAKGSVALDGVSLTVAGLGAGCFTIALVPYTMDNTTLGKWRAGTCVNVEIDILTKTVRRLLSHILPQKETLTAERLRELGF